MKILITGGFGFIGSNLIKKLLLGNHDITIIDDLSSGKEIFNKDIVFHNLATYESRCEKIFEEADFDIVIYLGFRGYSKENYSMNNKDLYLNNLGLNNILYLCEKYNVKKVVILSSFKVYGEEKLEPYREVDNNLPNSFEGSSYLSREVIAKEYKKLGLNVVILRVGVVYGPGQYGTDISFLKEDVRNIGDFIFIEDLCDVIIKVIYNHTEPILNVSNGEGSSNIMDNSKVKFTLDWYPKYSFEEGLSITKNSINVEDETVNLEDKKKQGVIQKIISMRNKFENKDLEVTILFFITFVINYLIKFKMGLDIDVFLLYIVFISLIYGLKQGLISASLSIISYAWFSFNYYEKSVLYLVTDINTILYLTLYFFLGVSIGYLVDEQKKNKLYLIEEVSFVKGEINFIKELYEKSGEVNKNLQSTIENYENNLTRTNNIIKRLSFFSIDRVHDEIIDIYFDYFYPESVILYDLNPEKTSLTLMSFKGDLKHNKFIKISDYDFLYSVINDKSIYVNRELNKEYPTVCISICLDELLNGVIFLDNIEFNKLNQYYLNNLKLTTSLIENLVSNGSANDKITSKYERAISNHEKIQVEYEKLGSKYDKLIYDYKKAMEENEKYMKYLKDAEKWIRKMLGVK